MNSLRSHDFQIYYSAADDRLRQFYIPALSRSIRYDRSAGYFSSSALAIAAAGVARLIQNGGTMRLLVGAQLDDADVAAIQWGHDLRERVERKLLAGFTDPEDALMRDRLRVLAWMVAEGTLEFRVVLPRGPDGSPLSASASRDYFHVKSGVFTDPNGDQIAFSGSVNESEQAWVHNYEELAVFRSWDPGPPHLQQIVRRFERLWRDEEASWIVLDIPRAVRERLIAYRPDRAPAFDPVEIAPVKKVSVPAAGPFLAVSQRERILFQYLRDAPYFPDATGLGSATSAILPWPHQSRVAGEVIERYPEGFLLCDEVGLGKTIEAGLVIRQLLISGRVKRCLILAPKSVARQWQEELYEKFALNLPLYDGQTFFDIFGEQRPTTTENPWDAHPAVIASSQLVKRLDRQRTLLDAQPWDLIVVDEAHHARRKDFLQNYYRANRLLELLTALKSRTHSFLLLTATPMQVDPVEVWDLLRVLGLGGRWGANEENFLQFFEELRKPPEDADWDLVFEMVRDYLETGGGLDPVFERVAREKLGVVEGERLRELPTARDRTARLRQLSPSAAALVGEFARRHTPLRRFLFRNTRDLLREYQRRGILREKVPHRDPRPKWIPLKEDEKQLYDRIDEYITRFYHKYEREKKGLGFVMTVYRRRLTSSFYAVRASLQRRLDFVRGKAAPGTVAGLDEDDLEQDDLQLDITEDVAEAERSRFKGEVEYIEDFLSEINRLGTDSKLEQLHRDLNDIFRQRETVLIFTQYTDTMDYLREQLRQVYGSQVACFSGRGGEVWNGIAWAPTTKEQIKKDFREGGQVKILLGTEALSEGLNMQTCGVLINYDMPWNPMRVEQRIGRIDRIGQVHDPVWLYNYFYEDTVEAVVYRRLADRIDWFETVVGDLQPILSRVARSIQTLAMLPADERRRQMEEVIEGLRAAYDARQSETLRLDEYLEAGDPKPGDSAPVTLKDIEAVFTASQTFRPFLRPHPSLDWVYTLQWEGQETAVTFDRAVFDEHPDTVRLLTYGDRLFEAVLASVPPPDKSPGERRGLLHLSADGEVPARAILNFAHTRPERVSRIGSLRDELETAGTAGWPEAAASQASAAFKQEVAEIVQRIQQVRRARAAAERRALEENARQLLLRAALIELALGQQPDMLGEPLPWEFSEAAITGLRRHKYPFAPLLRLVDVSDLRPSRTDPYYRQIQNLRAEQLKSKFSETRTEAKRLVKRMAPEDHHGGIQRAAGEVAVLSQYLEPGVN